MLFVFVLATFIGLGVIRRVSRLLHTPLMSLTNAISAIAVVGAILVDRRRLPAAHPPPRRHRAVRLDDQHRQRLPDHRPHAEDVQDRREAARRRQGMTARARASSAYLVATALFIFALHWMNDPDDRPPRRVGGRGRHGPRGPRHLGAAGDRPSPLDRRGAIVAGSPSACRSRGCRSPRCRSGPRCRTPSAAWPPASSGTAKYYLWLGEGPEKLTPFRMIALIVEIILGFPHVHRQPDGGRQAAGSEVDSAAAGHLSAAERHQPRPASALAVGVGAALALNPTAAWAPLALPGHHRAGAGCSACC